MLSLLIFHPCHVLTYANCTMLTCHAHCSFVSIVHLPWPLHCVMCYLCSHLLCSSAMLIVHFFPSLHICYAHCYGHLPCSVPFSTCRALFLSLLAVLCFFSPHMLCLVYDDIHVCYAHLYAMLCSFLHLPYSDSFSRYVVPIVC